MRVSLIFHILNVKEEMNSSLDNYLASINKRKVVFERVKLRKELLKN